MRVAFASNDKKHVDEHFGWAKHFVIWEIDPEDARLVGAVQVESKGDDEEDKIEARLNVLRDCAIVYVNQIGGPAAARLVHSKIHPIKSRGKEAISVLVWMLQKVLRDSPPPWLRKAMLKGERPGFVGR